MLIRELWELRKPSHRHLVKIIGSYSDREYIACLMKPVAEGSLEHFIGSRKPLKAEAQVILRRFYGCLSGAVHYLHENKIRHRDLGARNILVSRGEVYISDFGSVYNWKNEKGSMTRHHSTPVSPDYMAPEIAKEQERGSPSDMWSLGIVFLKMATKLLVYSLSDFRNRIKRYAAKSRVQPYPYANIPTVIEWMPTLGNTCTEFEHDKEPLVWVRELLHPDPDNRVTARQLMRYCWQLKCCGWQCVST
jgi:serine/threonine protein kinase